MLRPLGSEEGPSMGPSIRPSTRPSIGPSTWPSRRKAVFKEKGSSLNLIEVRL
ncbi:hypothetical protein Tco_0081286, partial [Tanacetum coccineum]